MGSVFFFFSSRRRHTRFDCDWSSDVCSSDLPREDYFSTVQRLIRLPRRLTIVADAGNGIAGVYGPELLRRLGCQVVELHCESDGSFPNHLPDPADPENLVDLQEKVVDGGRVLGVGWR